MSAIGCDDLNHEACKECGCVRGLGTYQGPETACPKCSSELPKVMYHSHIIISMGEEEWPCAQWAREDLLRGPVGEHLCIRCQRCGYGYPAKTADSS